MDFIVAKDLFQESLHSCLRPCDRIWAAALQRKERSAECKVSLAACCSDPGTDDHRTTTTMLSSNQRRANCLLHFHWLVSPGCCWGAWQRHAQWTRQCHSQCSSLNKPAKPAEELQFVQSCANAEAQSSVQAGMFSCLVWCTSQARTSALPSLQRGVRPQTLAKLLT